LLEGSVGAQLPFIAACDIRVVRANLTGDVSEIAQFCDIFSIAAGPSTLAMLPDALELFRICDGPVPNPVHFATFIGAAEAAINVEFGRGMIWRRFRPTDTLPQVRVWASAEFGSVNLRHRGPARRRNA
jgi:hypothetical protein